MNVSNKRKASSTDLESFDIKQNRVPGGETAFVFMLSRNVTAIS